MVYSLCYDKVMNYGCGQYYMPVIAFNIRYEQVTELLCYCVIRMSQFVHNEEEALIGDDIDQE